MKKVLGAVFSISVFSILLFACGHSDSSNANSGIDVSKKVIMNSRLGATWSSGCITADGDGDGSTRVDQYEFFSDSIYVTSTLYLDSTCTYAAAKVLGLVNVVPVATDSSGLVFNAQFSMNQISTLAMVPLDSKVVSGFNQTKICGSDSWSLNVAQSILNTSCVQDIFPMTDATVTTFTISADGKTLQDETCHLNGSLPGQCDPVESFTRGN